MKGTWCGLLIAGMLYTAAAAADWTELAADPAPWPYADGPTTEVVALPHSVYAMASTVGLYEGAPAIFSIGGYALNDYSLGAPGSDPVYPTNRQSHFSIYRPGSGWSSADGSDDIPNGNGTWTSVGLTGYNNGNGQLSPTIGQGTSIVGDQAFVHDGAVYVYGGYPQWGGQMAKYEFVANSWSQVARGDDLGLYGGGGGVIGDVWYKIHADGALLRYDPATDTFAADIPVPGLAQTGSGEVYGGGAGSAVIDGLLYVLDRDGTLQAIDPVAATVGLRQPSPDGVYLAGTAAFDGRLYVFGGRSAADPDAASDRIQVYDPATDSWAYSSARLPEARYGMLAEILGDTLYLGNGSALAPDGTPVVFDDFWSIPMAQVSTVVPLPPAGLLFASAGLLIGYRRRVARGQSG